MKNVFISCLLAFPLLLVSAAPLDVAELSRRDPHSCTCHGRVHSDVDSAKHDSAHFSNFEKIHFPNCAKPLERWKLNNLDRAVYSGTQFCGCITHQGATTRNGFVAC